MVLCFMYTRFDLLRPVSLGPPIANHSLQRSSFKARSFQSGWAFTRIQGIHRRQYRWQLSEYNAPKVCRSTQVSISCRDVTTAVDHCVRGSCAVWDYEVLSGRPKVKSVGTSDSDLMACLGSFSVVLDILSFFTARILSVFFRIARR